MDHDEFRRMLLRHRQVEVPCSRCRGMGGRSYPSTATWRGGMGGASITYDVCDECWGSGDERAPWTNLRKERNEREAEVCRRVAAFWAEKSGAQFDNMHDAVSAIADELERLSRSRKPRPRFFDLGCISLAKTLRRCVTTSVTEREQTASDGARTTDDKAK